VINRGRLHLQCWAKGILLVRSSSVSSLSFQKAVGPAGPCMSKSLSNQLPNTPRALRRPPTWIPSLRQRSSPWKMEKVVQRISPSGVWRTVPVSTHQSHDIRSVLVRAESVIPLIRLFAFGSQLACRLLEFPRKCTTGKRSPLKLLQSMQSPSSSSSSSSPLPGGSMRVTCSLIRISRIAKRLEEEESNQPHVQKTRIRTISSRSMIPSSVSMGSRGASSVTRSTKLNAYRSL